MNAHTIAETSQGSRANRTSFRVAVNALLVADDLSAYDTEAVQRYVRESLEDERAFLNGEDVDLGFADGDNRNAQFVLPSHIEVEATLIDGEEGDPEGTMSQAGFSVEVPVLISFDVIAADTASVNEVFGVARELLSAARASQSIPFEDGCLGSALKLVTPFVVLRRW